MVALGSDLSVLQFISFTRCSCVTHCFRYPGFIVPALPEKRKQALFRFDLEFVEERRRALQTFIFNVCCHPFLRNAPELSLFCSSMSQQLYTEPVEHVLGSNPPVLSASSLVRAQVSCTSSFPTAQSPLPSMPNTICRRLTQSYWTRKTCTKR
jgi:hypothetical protein